VSRKRRVEVRVEARQEFVPPSSLAEADAMEADLLVRNEQLYRVRFQRQAEDERAREWLKLVREWKKARNRANRNGPETEREAGLVRALHDVTAFAIVALDEVDDAGGLPPLAARLQAELLETLPDGYLDRWVAEKLHHKVCAAEPDEDDPDVPPEPADERQVIRCFGRLRARCRRLHLALGPPSAREGTFCVCGTPHGGCPPLACATLAELARLAAPGSAAWLEAARSLDDALAEAEGRHPPAPV
jgi:hypothetical protein